MNTNSFDETKFYLGKVCKNGHDWNESGHSLRYKGGGCRQCLQEKYLQNRTHSPSRVYRVVSIDDTHYLGNLCIRGHEWENTGMSLRTLKRRECPECVKAYQQKNAEKYKEYKHSYYLRNKKNRAIESMKKQSHDLF